MASLAQEVVRLTRLVDDLRLLSLSDMAAHYDTTVLPTRPRKPRE